MKGPKSNNQTITHETLLKGKRVLKTYEKLFLL